MRRLSQFLISLVVTTFFVAPASASSILIGTNATASLYDVPQGFNPLQDSVTVVTPGAEITHGDGSNIGDNALLTGEFINIEASSIIFSIFGGGGDQGTPGYQLTGYDPGAHYVISDLFNPGVATITGVSVVLNNIVGAALGSEIFFDDHSVTLNIDTLGVLTSPSNLGTVTLNLTVQDVDNGGNPPPVPEPMSLVLVGTGMSMLGLKYRGRRRPSPPARRETAN